MCLNCDLKELNNSLLNTIWINDPDDRLAYVISNGGKNIQEVYDVTYWIINQVKSNYFFGYSYTFIDGTFSTANIAGFISKDKSVTINFINGQKLSVGYGTIMYPSNCLEYYEFSMRISYQNGNSVIEHKANMKNITTETTKKLIDENNLTLLRSTIQKLYNSEKI